VGNLALCPPCHWWGTSMAEAKSALEIMLKAAAVAVVVQNKPLS